MKWKVSDSEQNDSTATANTATMNASATGSKQPMTWVSRPDEVFVIDDAFWVRKQQWGTYVSVDLNEKELITSHSEEACIAATRWWLKAKQEGFQETGTSYDSTVGGKL